MTAPSLNGGPAPPATTSTGSLEGQAASQPPSTTSTDSLLAQTEAQLAQRAREGPGAPPLATYRLQFHRHFRFTDARRIVPYLADLGISHCYASPYLKARPGSMHGYDISNHALLNPEVGSEEDHLSWTSALQSRGMGQILDVVPNHMGIVGNENVWWNDVLENGPSSPYAAFFDIDWHPSKPDLGNKVLLPILGDVYGAVLERGELKVHYEGGAFTVRYFDHSFPVAPCTYGKILDLREKVLGEALTEEEATHLVEYQSIQTAVSHLPPSDSTDPHSIEERHREKEVIKRRLDALTKASPRVLEFLHENLALINGSGPIPEQENEPAQEEPQRTVPRSATPASRRFDLLDDLLNAQPYRLAYWRVASDEINYRRFFDINELAALSMEKPEVFEATHKRILALLSEGKIHGLRIDHPDGLFDPRQYLNRLQEHFIRNCACKLQKELDEDEIVEAIRQRRQANPQGPLWRPLYVVVEKILGHGEALPEDWPTHGTTGYEFLISLNGVFVDRRNARAFNRLYRRWTKMDTRFRDLVYQKKFLIMQVSLSSELNVLANQLDRLSERGRWSRDYTLNSLRRALREIIACFGVYRSYITGPEIRGHDRLSVEKAVSQAKRRNPAISPALFDFIRDVLLLETFPGQTWMEGEEQKREREAEVLRFIGKFQQVTSPVMAKGVEDTAFYVYNRLISLNEVGGEPDHFGTTLPEFHRANQARQARTPYALSATATHDTKRGEDTRARINVLSEMPGDWQEALARWRRLNKRHITLVDEEPVPDRNVGYFFYQTLLGTWPLGANEPTPEYVERIQNYLSKAMREAKVHTSWVHPNPPFEEALRRFIADVLDPCKSCPFLQDFLSFQRVISHYGLFNSLAQVLLKFTAPGIPDTYQGTELWDFSLVDPDNRRPVDYDLRARLLAELRTRISAFPAGEPSSPESPPPRAQLARHLTETREDGRIKLYVLLESLRCRQQDCELFTTGQYIPAEATGSFSNHVCAFIRRRQGAEVVAAAPRLLKELVGPEREPLGVEVWKDGAVLMPGAEAGQRYRNVFTDEFLVTETQEGQVVLPLAPLFANFPVALLWKE
jgi:(1->4)-alpha-D-glucan 1-alpha-D-glucosylmutase